MKSNWRQRKMCAWAWPDCLAVHNNGISRWSDSYQAGQRWLLVKIVAQLIRLFTIDWILTWLSAKICRDA